MNPNILSPDNLAGITRDVVRLAIYWGCRQGKELYVR